MTFLVFKGLLHRHIPTPLPRSGKQAALQVADATGRGIEEDLPAEGRGAGLRRAAAIAADDRGRHEVRTVTGHE